MNRLLEYGIVTMWLVSMTWLVSRDAVPRWFAQSPPEAPTAAWLQDHGQRFQYGIYADNGARKGTSWSDYEIVEGSVLRKDILILHDLQFVKELVMTSELTFQNETGLDSVEVDIRIMDTAITLRGERQGPKFAFTVDINAVRLQEFVLEAHDAQTLCDSIKPFSALRDLSVGQTWTLQMLNPMSLIQNSRSRFKPVLVSVTGRENKQFYGRTQDCFIVESAGTRAWISRDGRVLLQVVDLPGMGRLEIREETWQQALRDTAFRQYVGLGRHVSHHRSR